MRPHLILAATSAFIILLAQASRADAGPVPTHIADAATFFSLATFYEEDMFFTSGHPLPDPYSQGRATLSTGGHNTIYTAGSAPFMPFRDVFASSLRGPIDGMIGDLPQFGPFDLIGFDIGNLVGPDPADLTLMFGSGGTFSTVVASTPIQAGLVFRGFRAPLGDFFTGFTLSAHGIDSRVGLADLFYGTTACFGPNCGSPTPEPTSWALMILGFGLTGAVARGRRARASSKSI